MSLLAYTDVENHLNIDLSNPTGRNVVIELIDQVESWVSVLLGYPLEVTSYVDIYDGGLITYPLRTLAPVQGTVTIEQYDEETDTWTAADNVLRITRANLVRLKSSTDDGFDNLRLSYKAGWDSTTLPLDLKQAMLELIALKLLSVANFSAQDPTSQSDTAPVQGALKRVQSDTYSEEYSTAEADAYWKAKAAQLSFSFGADVPAAIREVINRYRIVNV